jgi:S-(hydroxymethyl)glutathione dehydrogenase/alcohol dehydrogenase
MFAAVCYALDQPVRIEDVEIDAPRRGEVLVRMAASGVCHSDYSVITGVMPAKLPCVLGHEGAGIVERLGEGVEHLKVGDRVMLAWVTPCGVCFYCRIGKPQLCDVGAKINATFRQPDGTTRMHRDGVDLQTFSGLGALAERIVAPANACVKLPDDAPLDKAALIGCSVMTGVGAVFNTAAVRPGSSVAVFGAGGVGLNVIQGAAIAQAERIIAVDVNPRKLEFASAFGATDVVDASARDPVAAIRELTEGRGADYTFEAIGRKESIEQAYAAVRKGGTCVVIGIGSRKESVSLNVFLIPVMEKRLFGCWYGGADVHRDALRLLSWYREGKLKLDELLTRTYSLQEVNQAFADMNAGVNARGIVVWPPSPGGRGMKGG